MTAPITISLPGRYVVGIDPGLYGAIAFIDTLTGAVFVVDMPIVKTDGVSDIDRPALARVFDRQDVVKAFIERTEIRSSHGSDGDGRKQGAASTKKTLHNGGLLEGMAAANFWPVEYVASLSWKRKLGIPPVSAAGKTSSQITAERKELSATKARELLPHCHGLFVRKKDSGRCEAALIGLYGCRKLGLALPAQVTRRPEGRAA